MLASGSGVVIAGGLTFVVSVMMMFRSLMRREASPASASKFRQMLRHPEDSQAPESIMMVVATADHVQERTRQLIQAVWGDMYTVNCMCW